jgi:hypothetical protein
LRRAKWLPKTRNRAVPLRDRRRFRFSQTRYRDYRRRDFGIVERFQDREAMHTGVEIDDDNIDILKAHRQNLKRLPAAADFYQAAPGLFGCFGDSSIRLDVAIGYQENLAFHTTSEARQPKRDAPVFVNLAAKIVLVSVESIIATQEPRKRDTHWRTDIMSALQLHPKKRTVFDKDR